MIKPLLKCNKNMITNTVLKIDYLTFNTPAAQVLSNLQTISRMLMKSILHTLLFCLISLTKGTLP